MTDPRAEARDELAHRWGATTLAEAAAQELARIVHPPGPAELVQAIAEYRRQSTPPATGRPNNDDPGWVKAIVSRYRAATKTVA